MLQICRRDKDDLGRLIPHGDAIEAEILVDRNGVPRSDLNFRYSLKVRNPNLLSLCNEMFYAVLEFGLVILVHCIDIDGDTAQITGMSCAWMTQSG